MFQRYSAILLFRDVMTFIENKLVSGVNYYRGGTSGKADFF